MANTFLRLLFIIAIGVQWTLAEPSRKFRLCEDSEFCTRTRSFVSAQNKHQQLFHYVEPSSIYLVRFNIDQGLACLTQLSIQQESEVNGVLVNSNNPDLKLQLKMSLYQGGILRVIIDDILPKKHKRFQVSGQMGFESHNLRKDKFSIKLQSEQQLIIESRGSPVINEFHQQKQQEHETYTYVIEYKPFKVSVFLNNHLQLVVNKNNYFNFETERTVREQKNIYNKRPYDATYFATPEYNQDQEFVHEFNEAEDRMIYGPRAIAMDFEFTQPFLYGIPEHAADFQLQDTLFAQEKRQPYRLYNIDVAQYQINSSQALYGAIPFLVGHNPSQLGHVGLYWANAAETWVDLYSPEGQKARRGSLWMSETGILEFFVILGSSTKQIMSKWADISGHAAMPQYFSLGYHQSKWSLMTADDILELNENFDQNNIPLDVIWLDIDVRPPSLCQAQYVQHAHKKQYFTWDPIKFGVESLQTMHESINLRQRKLVTIQDPHIHIDVNYPIFKWLSDIESETVNIKKLADSNTHIPSSYFVSKASHNAPFQGECWPGESVLLDFLQQKVRAFWSALYGYTLYQGTDPNVYAWNDMNEPSILNQVELTLPKGTLQALLR